MNEEQEQVETDEETGAALISGTSSKGATDILFPLLMEVIRRHQPELEAVFAGGANISDFSPELMARALQAQGIWFQLLSIADQNAAMRRRRHIERTRGRESLRGTFDNVLADAAEEGIAPKEIEDLLRSLRIRPVITAPQEQPSTSSTSVRTPA